MESHEKGVQKMKKVIIRMVTSICILVVICLGVILYQNTFHMKVKSVEIPTTNGLLKGKLILPQNAKSKVGLVVFIHGDGPADASYDGNYEPLWEELANQGYASLSWNKPGIDGSEGNWLDQSMDDRAIEAVEAINWAHSLPEIDTKRIGLWGASQAGWVIPKIVQKDDDIAFTILVAPAINWVEQGRYNTLAQMKKEGASITQQEQALENFDQYLSIFERGISYQDYLKSPNADKNISEDRWNFERRNYKADASEDIKHFYSPIKLFLGGRDINVDTSDTEKVYQANVPENLLSVTVIPTADHFMLRPALVDSNTLTVLTALFAPRQLADQHYYEGIRNFLQSIDESLMTTKE